MHDYTDKLNNTHLQGVSANGKSNLYLLSLKFYRQSHITTFTQIIEVFMLTHL